MIAELDAKHRALATVLIAIPFVMLLLGLAGCKRHDKIADAAGVTVKVNGLDLPIIPLAHPESSIEGFRGEVIHLYPGQHSSYGTYMTALYNSAPAQGYRLDLAAGQYLIATPVSVSPHSQMVGRLDKNAIEDGSYLYSHPWPGAVLCDGMPFGQPMVQPTHDDLFSDLSLDGGCGGPPYDPIDTLAHSVTTMVVRP